MYSVHLSRTTMQELVSSVMTPNTESRKVYQMSSLVDINNTRIDKVGKKNHNQEEVNDIKLIKVFELHYRIMEK